MSDITDRLDELLADTRAAVAASTLASKDDVTITDDGRKVVDARSLAAGAIVIYAFPGTEWPAPKMQLLTWTIGVVADGPTPRAAASRIHDLVAVLRAAGVVRWADKAAATDFELPDQASVPGYAITHIEQHRSTT